MMETVCRKEFPRSKVVGAAISFLLLSGVASFLYVYLRKSGRKRGPARKLDIEIRYEAPKDADATLMAQNQVKVLRMILVPLEKKILREGATLIFVYGGDYWEMRLRNASTELKHAIRDLLEQKEW